MTRMSTSKRRRKALANTPKCPFCAEHPRRWQEWNRHVATVHAKHILKSYHACVGCNVIFGAGTGGIAHHLYGLHQKDALATHFIDAVTRAAFGLRDESWGVPLHNKGLVPK